MVLAELSASTSLRLSSRLRGGSTPTIPSELELLEANAESVPLDDDQFDLAISEYGASIWCDPTRWIPEAARLLRSGGELVFMRNSTLSMLCIPDTGKVAQRFSVRRRG